MNLTFSSRLKLYIHDFFQDQTKEIQFYEGLLKEELKTPQKSEEIIEELNQIIEEIGQRETLNHRLFNPSF